MGKIIRTPTKAEGDITEKEKIEMGKISRKWIENSFKTEPINIKKITESIKSLYKVCALKEPRVVIVSSPFIMALAYGLASGWWYLKKKKVGTKTCKMTHAATEATHEATRAATYAATEATRAATYEAIDAATHEATRAATRAATYEAIYEVTYAAIDAATDEATDEATRAATHEAIDKATDEATHAATREAIDAATRAATHEAIDAATRAATHEATYEATLAATYAATEATRAATYEAIDAATRAATHEATYEATLAATHEATYEATHEATYEATRAATHEATDEATHAATREAIDAATRAATHEVTHEATKKNKWLKDLAILFGGENYLLLLNCIKNWSSVLQGGNMWAGWQSYVDAMENVIGLTGLECFKKHKFYTDCARHGGFRVMHEEFCIVSDFPEVFKINNQNRSHCENGPSHRWRDGFEIYHLNGVRMEKWMVMTPAEQIEPRRILKVGNAEQRRELLRKVGVERFIQKTKHTVLDSFQTYTLIRFNFDEHNLVYLKMLNPSVPGVWHVEGVPRNCKTIREALHFRKPKELRKLPIDEVNGEDWYQQGDVCIWPEEAKSLKFFPSILT